MIPKWASIPGKRKLWYIKKHREVEPLDVFSILYSKDE